MVFRCLLVLMVFLASPALAQYSSHAVPRTVLIEEQGGDTHVMVGLPAIVVYAAVAQAHGAELAPLLLRKWLSEPHGLDLAMFQSDPSRLAPLLNHTVRVGYTGSEATFQLTEMSARRLTPGDLAQKVSATSHPPITEVWIEARFVASGSGPVSVTLANVDLPLDYHFDTAVKDTRFSPPQQRQEIGHLNEPLTFPAPSD